MLRNYLSASWSIVKARPLSFVFSVSGLALALAFFVLAIAYVQFETRYDRWVPEFERIYRVDTVQEGRRRSVNFMRDDIEAVVRDVPGVEAVGGYRSVELPLEHDAQITIVNALLVESAFLRILNISFLRGDLVVPQPGVTAVAIAKSRAISLFGDVDVAVGKELSFLEGEFTPPENDELIYQVTAVFDDWRPDSHLDADMLLMPATGSSRYIYYVKLEDGMSSGEILPAFQSRHKKAVISRLSRNNLPAANVEFFAASKPPVLTSLTDIHLKSGASNRLKRLGDGHKVISIRIVGIVILLVGSANFAGFLIGHMSGRLREIVVRKVCGMGTRVLLGLVLMDVVLLVASASVLAGLFVAMFYPALKYFLDVPIDILLVLADGLWFWIAIALTGVVALSVLVPYITVVHIRPAAIFGGLSRSPLRHRSMVMGSLVFEVALTVAVLIGTLTFFYQLRYVSQQHFSFKAESTFFVTTGMHDLSGRYTPGLHATISNFRDDLTKLPGVSNVSFGSGAPLTQRPSFVRLKGVTHTQLSFGCDVVTIGPGYFDQLGVGLLAGRGFNEADYRKAVYRATANFREGQYHGYMLETHGSPEKVLVNQAAARRLGYSTTVSALGGLFYLNELDSADSPEAEQRTSASTYFEIIGVVPNLFHEWQYGEESRPAVYLAGPNGVAADLLVQYDGVDRRDFTERVTELYRRHFPLRVARHPGKDIPGVWVDEEFDYQLLPEKKRLATFMWLSALLILVTALGLYNTLQLVLGEQRREMAIRKVFGSASGDVARRLFWTFLKPVILANAIAWPVGYILMDNWLASYADRIEVGLEILVLAGVVPPLLTGLVLSGEAYRMARIMPCRDLKPVGVSN